MRSSKVLALVGACVLTVAALASKETGRPVDERVNCSLGRLPRRRTRPRRLSCPAPGTNKALPEIVFWEDPAKHVF